MADWMARYRDYERHCIEAAKLPEGQSRDEAFVKAHAEYEALMAEPDAPKVVPVDPFEAASAELSVAVLYGAVPATTEDAAAAQIRRLIREQSVHQSPRTAASSDAGNDQPATAKPLSDVATRPIALCPKCKSKMVVTNTKKLHRAPEKRQRYLKCPNCGHRGKHIA